MIFDILPMIVNSLYITAGDCCRRAGDLLTAIFAISTAKRIC